MLRLPLRDRVGSLLQLDILNGCMGRNSCRSPKALRDVADAVPMAAALHRASDARAMGPLAGALFKQGAREVSEAMARERLLAVLPAATVLPESPHFQTSEDGDALKSILTTEFFSHLTSEECLADSDVWRAARVYCRTRALQDFPPARLWPEVPLPDASALFSMPSEGTTPDASPREGAEPEYAGNVDSWSDALTTVDALEIHAMTLLPCGSS